MLRWTLVTFSAAARSDMTSTSRLAFRRELLTLKKRSLGEPYPARLRVQLTVRFSPVAIRTSRGFSSTAETTNAVVDKDTQPHYSLIISHRTGAPKGITFCNTCKNHKCSYKQTLGQDARPHVIIGFGCRI